MKFAKFLNCKFSLKFYFFILAKEDTNSLLKTLFVRNRVQVLQPKIIEENYLVFSQSHRPSIY